ALLDERQEVEWDKDSGGLEVASAWSWGLALLAEAARQGPGAAGKVNVVVLGAALGLLERAGRWQEALSLLVEAKSSRGLKPNSMNYASAVSACAKGQVWEPAIALLAELREGNVVPDVVVRSAAISACERCFHWQHSLLLLGEMEEDSVSPDSIAYSTAMLACNKAGRWELSLDLLELAYRSLSGGQDLLRRAQKGSSAATVKGDAVAQRQLLSILGAGLDACAEGGCWREALALLDQISELSDAQIAEGRLPEAAVQDHRRFREAQMTAMLACGSLAGAGAAWPQCLQLLERLEAPDLKAFGCAVRACAYGRSWQAAVEILADMHRRDVPDDQGSVWNVVAWACQASGAVLPAAASIDPGLGLVLGSGSERPEQQQEQQ
ncbi:unnamed protein product, partial [Polarella glacialis]